MLGTSWAGAAEVCTSEWPHAQGGSQDNSHLTAPIHYAADCSQNNCPAYQACPLHGPHSQNSLGQSAGARGGKLLARAAQNSKCQGDKGRTPKGSTRNSYPGTHVRPHIMAVFTNYITAIFFYQIRKKAKFEWHICLIKIKYTEMSWNITEM